MLPKDTTILVENQYNLSYNVSWSYQVLSIGYVGHSVSIFYCTGSVKLATSSILIYHWKLNLH